MSGIMTLRGKASVFAGAALLRLVLFLAFPGLPDLLTGRVEISTPVTSFKRCKRATSSRHFQVSSVHLLTAFSTQYKKDFSSTRIMYRLTMAASTIKPRCCSLYSPCSPT